MSRAHHFIRSDESIVEVCTTDRSDGDFHLRSDPDGLRARRHGVMPGEWATVDQVHGAEVVVGDPRVSPRADAVVTSEANQPIAVQGADCAPIAFITDRGPVGVAHAGWRGLAAGVISATVRRLSEGGGATTCAVVGPVICPDCYEFGADDLDVVADALGEGVRSVTATGTPALDLRAAITGALAECGVDDVRFVAGCTACGDVGFSHRARHESERHALVARIIAADAEVLAL